MMDMCEGPQPNVKDCVASDSSIRGTLDRKKLRLEISLKEVNAALDALNDNPKVAEVLELVMRAR